jgi:hypothetical protein
VRNGFLSALLAVLAGVLVACGGADDKGGGAPPATGPPSPEQDARRAAQTILDGNDARTLCTRLVTRRLLSDMYKGDRQRCIAEPVNDHGTDAGTTKITGVTVDGATASVAVTTVGGEADGAAGTLELVREGNAWKLDALGADYLRAAFLIAIGQVHTGAIGHPAMRACFAKQARTMSEPRLRRVMSQGARDDPAVRGTLIAMAEKCPEALHAYIAQTLGDAIEKDGFRPAFVRCFKRELENFLPLVPISGELLMEDPDGITRAALAGLMTGIRKICGPTR